MATCCFLCQDPVYDNDIEERLDNAIAKVAQENDTVRFLLYGCWDISSRRFHDLFATAAYRAKLANPHKEISLSLVVHETERRQVLSALQEWRYFPPSLFFDENLSPPAPQGIKDALAIEKRKQRWMIGQADYVFTYLYDCLHEADSHARDYAAKTGKAIVDLTSPATYALIREMYSILPERKRKAMELRLEGKTALEIADALGTGKSRPQQLIYEGARAIRVKLRGREYRPVEGTCTVFMLGPATYESLNAFDKTVNYLVREKNVQTFFVAPNFSMSPFRFVLEKHIPASNVQMLCLGDCPNSLDTGHFDLETFLTEKTAPCLLDEPALAQVAAPYRISNLRFCPPELVRQIRETFMATGQAPFFCDFGKPFPESIT